MAERIRFHLDESVNLAIAQGLRRHGADVTTTQESGLLAKTDSDQLEFAVSQKRALVTHDEDFLARHQRGAAHCGIFYCHQQRKTVHEILHTLVLAWELLSSEEMKNTVEFL